MMAESNLLKYIKRLMGNSCILFTVSPDCRHRNRGRKVSIDGSDNVAGESTIRRLQKLRKETMEPAYLINDMKGD